MSRPRAPSTTPQFSFRLDSALRADLEALAENDDRSLGFYIERVVREHRDRNTALLAKLRSAAGRAEPTPPAHGNLAPEAEEEARIDRLLAKEQKKRQSAPHGVKSAEGKKSAAEAGE